MAILLSEGKQRYTTSAGIPLAGGKVYTYAAGTSTPKATYADAAGATPNANPIILDARGEATIFWSGAYKVTLKDASDVLIWTVDNITATDLATTAGASLVGTADGSNVQASLTALYSTAGAGIIGYISTALSAVARTVADVFIDNEVSVFDFLTTAQRADVKSRARTLDVTAAVNACFAAAQAAGKGVYVPNGDYLVTNLLFGSQATGAQSSAPFALRGPSRGGANFVASAGTTGILLKSWSCSGVLFENFTLTTTGTTAQAWDAEWKPGTGPSSQNVIRNIRVSSGTTTSPIVNLKNLNDTFPDELIVNAQTSDQCCIDMTQGGGLARIQNSTWNIGFLRFGCQNGSISNCWGNGIQWASSCLNYVDLIGCYLYPNSNSTFVEWSQAFSSFQSVRALVHTSCQFIGTQGATTAVAYFNLNGYSALDFMGCQWIGTATNLLGASSRKDSSADVMIRIYGGAHTGALVLNNITGFEYDDVIGLINDATGLRVTKTRGGTFTPTIAGVTATTNTAEYTRTGNSIRISGRLIWNAQTASPTITLPYINAGTQSRAVSIGYNGNSFGGSIPFGSISNGTAVIGFTNATNGGALAPSAAGDIIYSVEFPASA